MIKMHKGTSRKSTLTLFNECRIKCKKMYMATQNYSSCFPLKEARYIQEIYNKTLTFQRPDEHSSL